MLKSVLQILLIFLLILGISGCSNYTVFGEKEKTTVTTASINDAESSAAAANSDLPPVTLTFLIPGGEKTDSKEVLDKVAEKSGLNIKLDFKFLPGLYWSELKTAIESNQPFDALYAGMPEWYDMTDNSCNYIDLARNGRLKDITELLPEYAPTIFSQLGNAELNNSTIDGRLYTVPSLFPLVSSINAVVNMDLMKKYELGPISTFEDYENYLKIIKENEPDIIPGLVKVFDQDMFMIPYGYVLIDNALSLVYKWDDPDMKILPWEQTDEFKAVSKMLSEWQTNGYLANDLVDKAKASFIGMGNLPKECTLKIKQSDGVNSVNYDNMYGFILYKEAKIPRGNPIGNIYLNGAIALNADAPNPERTLMFLDWVQSSQENYNLFMYGIEERHYTLDGEMVVFPEESKKTYSSYPFWLNSPFRNIKYIRMSKDDEYASNDYRADYIDFINNRTFHAPNTGFYPDYRSISAEVQTRAGKYQELITNPLMNGQFDPGQINSIREQLKDAGTDKIVQELQRQLDTWRENHK